jgi:hypothetical protein
MEYAFCWGLLILGYCFHSWIDTSLVARMAKSMPPTQAANLGGILGGAVAFAVGVTVGWLAGRWQIVDRRPIESTDCPVEERGGTPLNRLREWFDSYPLSRGLLLASLALLAGAALGFWLLLASLVMVVAFSAGYWGRAMALRTVEGEF